jgi:hypothetical protein
VLAAVQTERLEREGRQISALFKARKLLGGEKCTLSDQQLSGLKEQLVALADVVVCAFVEQKKRDASF